MGVASSVEKRPDGFYYGTFKQDKGDIINFGPAYRVKNLAKSPFMGINSADNEYIYINTSELNGQKLTKEFFNGIYTFFQTKTIDSNAPPMVPPNDFCLEFDPVPPVEDGVRICPSVISNPLPPPNSVDAPSTSSSNNNLILKLIVGVVSLILLCVLLYFLFFRPQQ